MKKLLWIVFFGSLIACQQKAEEPDPRAEIRKMESELQDDVTLDSARAWKLTTAYQDYVKANPKDSISPYYLSKAADIYKEIPHKGLKAVNTYNKLYREYPNHPLAPRSVFMIGFVFDEKYHDRDRASRSYTFFLEEYPDHELADDARNLLAILQDTTSTNLEKIRQWERNADTTKLKSQE
ncbi:MAG TPA: hypothetical protein DCG19_02455 [Cryomorphaceae bacterium]|nr:hypothetical protein [Owenweeksia sp.]MBG00382.1 hypothetical protein [Owenweeksia sp.]HAD96235.1 hypothetical protein [Cryomorphaceae bacterium]HBF20265.1 hypothetical protein [Cryomorphaceae bacterium]|tara:strand:- start:5415 stop:5957 length:543 start_codon:yes stop_codon:yes gene_type:complete